ncbi:MAG TPA: SigE family RNA polymerase sigma factor [Mycobacteriales bacterium]|nr:SigE family RNA polymerase sigma factor [Mycobacteriales bacterium]
MDARGEQEFEDFVLGASSRLIRLAGLMTDDPHTAEDLLQTALAKTYLKWPAAREQPMAYLRRSMLNQRTDWWRRSRNREQLVGEPIERAGPGDVAEESADRDAIMRSLRILTRRERLIVILRYLEDLSEAEVAEELQISRGTVKSTLSRSLAKLRVDAVQNNISEVRS